MKKIALAVFCALLVSALPDSAVSAAAFSAVSTNQNSAADTIRQMQYSTIVDA